MTNNVPDGYQSITPYFTVDDAERLISFLTTAWMGDSLKRIATTMAGSNMPEFASVTP